ncbi:hypothetical protein [Steroidobacter gossypii]|nr:hypothetical protein [Steroidobacter gossypii]
MKSLEAPVACIPRTRGHEASSRERIARDLRAQLTSLETHAE